MFELETGHRLAHFGQNGGSTRDHFILAMAKMSQHSADVVLLVDSDGSLLYANPAAALTFGLAPGYAIGTNAISYLHPDDVDRVASNFLEFLEMPGATIANTARFVTSDNHIRLLEIVSTNCLDDPGIDAIIVNGRDITDRMRLETELLDQSLHDALTGLPNRILFQDRAKRILAIADRDDVPVSVLFVDVDNFKTINDALGHTAGDELLIAVAQRMTGTLRNAEIVSRFGGDEFVVLVDPHSSEGATDFIARRIHEVLSAPFEIDGHLISVTTSIGTASGRGESIDVLVRGADMAMYQAKAAGKNQTVQFDPQMQVLASDRLQLEIDLRSAIENREFVVLYQPMIDLRSHTMMGMEALIRWDHPTRGRLEPVEFIPFAENVGMIVDIDRFVLREACTNAVRWCLGDRNLTLAVNVSARQLASERLLDEIRSVLHDTGLTPDCLVLEVTETTIMQESATAIERLKGLRDLGVRLAIDDFGTGYSSLNYLRQLPIDILKIDRSFVREMHHSSHAEAIVHSLVELGKKLNLEMVAEGVELASQLDALEDEQCDTAQGFLFARPLEAPQLEVFLAEWSRGASRAYAKSTTGELLD